MNQQAPRVVIERIRANHVYALVVPAHVDVAVKQQAGNFLVCFFDGIGISSFHNQQSDIHHAVLAFSFIKAQVLVIAALDFLVHVHCKTHLSLCPTDSDRTFEYNAAKRRTNPFCIIYGLIIAWCVFFFKNSPDKSGQNFVQRDSYK